MAKYITALCIVGGLAIGVLAAYLNSRISRRHIDTNSMNAIMGTNVARLGVDILTLSATFLVCRYFDLPLMPTLLAVAVGLTAAGLLFLKKIANELASHDDAAEKDGGE